MSIDLHQHYDKLTDAERFFVDDSFSELFKNAKLKGIPLNGNDDAETAVDALARLVIASRHTKARTKSASHSNSGFYGLAF